MTSHVGLDQQPACIIWNTPHRHVLENLSQSYLYVWKFECSFHHKRCCTITTHWHLHVPSPEPSILGQPTTQHVIMLSSIYVDSWSSLKITPLLVRHLHTFNAHTTNYILPWAIHNLPHCKVVPSSANKPNMASLRLVARSTWQDILLGPPSIHTSTPSWPPHGYTHESTTKATRNRDLSRNLPSMSSVLSLKLTVHLTKYAWHTLHRTKPSVHLANLSTSHVFAPIIIARALLEH